MVERTITTHLPMRCFHECSVKKGCYRFPRHPQRPGRRVLASDPMARSAEEWEYVIGEGPAHDTRTEGPLQADVAQISERWPSYGPAVRELGVASVAAVPLRTRRSQVGSLVVLGADHRRDGHDLARLNAVGEAFLGVLLGDTGDGSTTEFPGLILAGVDHRSVVHQAAGIVVEVCGCSTDDALARLRARAFAQGVPLRALAKHVVDGTLDEILRD